MQVVGANSVEIGSVGYQRHRPEHTLLYQIVERHYPAFVEHLADAGKQLPGHVRQAFDEIGRASCRERVYSYWMAGELKKKKRKQGMLARDSKRLDEIVHDNTRSKPNTIDSS